jgi:hypothetical protein
VVVVVVVAAVVHTCYAAYACLQLMSMAVRFKHSGDAVPVLVMLGLLLLLCVPVVVVVSIR